MKVLWLASWYPNRIIPLEGDFVQRHARAVALYTPLTVIYVVQYGENIEIEEDKTESTITNGLTEIIIYFRFKKTGNKIFDKLVYNWKYYAVYRRFIKEYFKKTGIPELVHVHVPMKAGVIAKWIKRKWKIPYIVSEHSATYVKGPPDAFGNRSSYFRNTVKSIFRNASLVSSVSAHDGSIIKNKFGLKSMEIIHNTVNTNYFFLERVTQRPKFRFIHISVMTYQKNTEGIIKACAALKNIRQDWEIELIGRDLPKEIDELIDNLQLRNYIICSGEISNQMVGVHMQNAMALVMFSRYENFPCVIIEALCCGLPVITTNVGGIPEAINSSNGYMVESENENELLIALNRMLNEYEYFNRKDISEDARQKYNYSVSGKEFYNLYRKVLTQTTPVSF